MADTQTVRKLAKGVPANFLKAKREKAGAGVKKSVRNYTYSYDDGYGDVRLLYILRGDAGTYREELWGELYEGSFAYSCELQWSTEYGDFRGFVYNADDENGQYCYFFGDEEIEGLYLFSMAFGLYQQGDPPPFDIESSGLINRTEP